MIDAWDLAEDLERAGFARDQAHGLARALRDRSAEDLAAKHDLRELELRPRGAALTDRAEDRRRPDRNDQVIHRRPDRSGGGDRGSDQVVAW